ncbi:hypothetical protein [Mammaliicoccus sciuri]|uniref:hypothetical protein n=1 Tax=Mammaliicoccus sciuri TaxID=1296 RepID=UPI001FB4214C|nr:hypothetical protein [Mammaliicoccus sciuri]MCJ0965540.1 hypothetical protein [Mammaliicoccus sciuri]
MYMLFEHIWDYENSKTNVIFVSEDKENITNILSKYKFDRVLEFEERVIYELEDRYFVLVHTIKDNYLKKEVVI